MRIKNIQNQRGVTLIELSMSVSILAFIIAMTMSSWLLFMQKTNRINAQASLDMEARRIIEHFRSEMSKTSRDSIIFYPRNQAPYQAVSFALPSDQDGDGLIDMNPATSNILWRQTIVYHIFNQSTKPPQMRRTQFSNRNPTATFDERYEQVEKVVASGQGTDACLNNETESMKVMFENLFTGRLWHAEARFDCYAPTPNTRERVNFGVTPIQPGPQQIVFTIVDKNPLSSGRKIGLDRLAVSASGAMMEAELIADASAIPKVYTGLGLASAGYGLLANTSANGQQVAMTLNNDALEEPLFIGEDRNVLFSNTVVRLDTQYKPTGFDSGVLCAKLDGQCLTSWTASEQALNPGSTMLPWAPPLTNIVIRIPILSDSVLNAAGEPNSYGVRKGGFNPVFRLIKSQSNGKVRIIKASMVIIPPAEVPAIVSKVPTIGLAPEIIPLQPWQNGNLTTWLNARPLTSTEPSQLVEYQSPRRNINIQTGSTIMLQLQMDIQPGAPMNQVEFLSGNRAELPGCWIKYAPNLLASESLMNAPTWATGPDTFLVAHIPFIRSMVVNYPDGGDYISNAFDTTDVENKPKNIVWEAQMPTGGGGVFKMYARSGNSLSENGFEIQDASAWSMISQLSDPPPPEGHLVGNGRYVQFRTVFESQKSHLAPDMGPLTSSVLPGPYRNDTPRLRFARVTWSGAKKYVDVGAELLKGPDCGIFTVKVNGQELVRGVTMEIEIFKDVRGAGGVPVRIRSGISTEVDPRNSGK